MKSFILILLISLQPTVKQYKIYEAEEKGVHYLQSGSMAITDKIIYLKLDTVVYTFNIQKEVTDASKDVYFVGYDSLYEGQLYSIYKGSVIVFSKQRHPETGKEEGNIRVECWSLRSYRKVIYKYR